MNDPLLEAERPLMQRLNLTDYIMPNLILDQQRTTQARNDLLSSISPASGMVMAGQRIIGQGDMVTETNYRVLNSLEREMQRRQDSNKQITYKMIGNAIYVFILVLLFTAYLRLFRKDYFSKPRCVTMLYVFIAIFPILVSLMMENRLLQLLCLRVASCAGTYLRAHLPRLTHCLHHSYDHRPHLCMCTALPI